MSLRVVLDATVLCLRKYTKGGQQRYVRELLRHLPAVESDNEYVLWLNFAHPANLPLYDQVRRDLKASRCGYGTVLCRIPPQVLRALRVPIETLTGPADVFHAPTAAWALTRRAKRVVTIHDLAYFDYPECFDGAQIGRWKRDVKWLADQATMVITVSEFARGTIVERLGVDPHRIRVTYHGVSRMFFEGTPSAPFDATQSRFGIRRPYVLFVSTVQPNKNVARLLEAFDLLRRSELRGWQLVVAGQPGWLVGPIFAAAEKMGVGGDIVFTGFVEDGILAELYRHAEVFVLPSLAEGFGIPAIEAMACGAPVVVSKTGALPEIVGDAGVLVDPYSCEDIARGILEAATDQTLRASLVARGSIRASVFRWERTARETVAAYRDVAQM